VIIMQRVHEQDLAGLAIAEGAAVLCLPMRFEPDHPHRCPDDPRTQPRELLDPGRVPEAEVAALETRLGPSATAAQQQQRPTPAGGLIFLDRYFREWIELPDPARGEGAISVDCTFKSTDGSDQVCVQCWLRVGPDFFLVDERCEHLGFVDTCAAVLAMCARYPWAAARLVEDKANGSAVIEVLSRDVPGLLPVEPGGGKVARAYATEPLYAAGNVFVPHPTEARYPDGRRGATWVAEHRAELQAFPRGRFDDRVDAATQALRHLQRGDVELFRRAMNNF
jgi:predicted phage terminase large subunit-like protein